MLRVEIVFGRTCFVMCPDGGIGRHTGLKIPRILTGPCRFNSGSGHQASPQLVLSFLSFAFLSRRILVV
jgi:hypothetical protein